MESSVDLAKKIAETLNWKLSGVQDTFSIEENKQGFFVLTLKPKKFLDPADFKTVCALTRDLGGEGEYVKATRSWKVPGAYAKKGSVSAEKTSEPAPAATSKTVEKKPPPVFGPGFYQTFPVASVLSPEFSLRLNIAENIKELADQISTTQADGEQCVILEPLICRTSKQPGFVEVAAGERRLLAARTLGLETVPVIVKNLSDEEFDRIRAMENLARKDLSDYEIARLLKYLMDTYPKTYPTQEAIGQVFGRTQQWVSQHLQMLQLENSNITTRVVMESGNLTERQARALHATTPEEREQVLDEANTTGKFPSARRIDEIRTSKSSVACTECGELTSNPVSSKDGQFYCSLECKQDAETKAASDTGEVAPLGLEPTRESTKEESVDDRSLTREDLEEPPEASERNKALKAVQIGTFDCTECSKHFAVEHWPDGSHKLREIKEAP
jgi:ParB/RepB/Spo0J family partition protein